MRDLNQEFVSALFNARNRVRFAMDEQFKPLGVTDASWRALFYLEQEGDGVPQKNLAKVMGIEGPSLVRLLDNLELKHFIERKSSTEDRRSKTIHLTSESRALLKTLHKVSTAVQRTILSDITDSELEVCTRVLQKVITQSRELGDG